MSIPKVIRANGTYQTKKRFEVEGVSKDTKPSSEVAKHITRIQAYAINQQNLSESYS